MASKWWIKMNRRESGLITSLQEIDPDESLPPPASRWAATIARHPDCSLKAIGLELSYNCVQLQKLKSLFGFLHSKTLNRIVKKRIGSSARDKSEKEKPRIWSWQSGAAPPRPSSQHSLICLLIKSFKNIHHQPPSHKVLYISPLTSQNPSSGGMSTTSV